MADQAGESFCVKLKQRVVVGGLISLAVFSGFHQQKIFESALRDMSYRKTPTIDPSSNSDCPVMLEMDAIENHHKRLSEEPGFFWEKDIPRAITRAFFVGFFILSIPVGVMSDCFGGQWFLATGLLVISTCTLLFPTLAQPDPSYFIVGRLCQGAAHAVLQSSCIVILAHWVPHSERATFIGVVYAMKQFGAVFGQLHIVLFRKLEFEWMSMCYTSGTVGLLCAVLLIFFVHDSPGKCPHLSERERDYIRSQTRHAFYRQGKTEIKQLVPWKQMFSSKPFLSMLVFHFGWTWIRIVLEYRLDNYLMFVLHLTRKLTYKSYGILLLSMGISSVLGGLVGDSLIASGRITRSTQRKLFGFLGNTLILPLLPATLTFGCNGAAVCAVYVVVFYMNGLVDCSFAANVLDLAPRHAGASFAILNCTYALSVLFNRELFLFICEDHSDKGQWLLFFLACSATVITCSVPFLFFGSAEVQPYNSWDGRPVPRRSEELQDQALVTGRVMPKTD